MAGAEFFRNSILNVCKPDLLDPYISAQRTIQRAINTDLEPPPDPHETPAMTWSRLMDRPEQVAHNFDPDSPITRAAMLIGAVSLKAYLFRDATEGYLHKSFEDVWRGTRLQKMAAKCDEVISEIVPELSGKFVTVNIAEMHKDFIEKLHLGVPEHIVVTGLNAAGKSWILKYFSEFLTQCDIKASIIKMPRPDGPLSQPLHDVLKGNLKLSGNARQLLFLSDALDVDPQPETLMVFDRNPRTDAFVYGGPDMARVVLSTHEIFQGIYHTFIIDRNPLATKSRVESRSVAPRIFERDLETMVEQVIRFVKLTSLPGYYWINNDIPKDDNPAATALGRFLNSVLSSGVLQRHLIKLQRFDHVIQANEFFAKKSVEFTNKWWGAFFPEDQTNSLTRKPSSQ